MLLTSPALIVELRRVLAYPKLAAAIKDPDRLADLIEAAAVLLDPERTITAVSDPPDNRGQRRRPDRHSTAISARLRTPVAARVEHALISAIASGSLSTSGGRRRGLAEEGDEGPAGGCSMIVICALRLESRKASKA